MRRRDGDSRETRGLGGDRVEGRHAVKELLLAGTRKVRQVVISADQDPAPILDDIIDLADEAGVDIRELPRGRFDQMAATEAPQGVVAFAAPLHEYALEELIAGRLEGDPTPGGESKYRSTGVEASTLPFPVAGPPATDSEIEGDDLDGDVPESEEPDGAEADSSEAESAESENAGSEGADPADAEPGSGGARTQPLLLVVDGVTDPGNLGAILRTAECAGVTGVVLPRHRAARITPTVAKRAAGAIEHLKFAPVSGIPTALGTLAELGVWTVGLEVAADHTIWDLTIADAPLALVLGAEGRGLSRLVRRRCDVTARIPVTGRLDSLNVSAATAVALFEILRRRSGGSDSQGS